MPSFSPPHQREPVVVVPTDRPMPVRLDCQATQPDAVQRAVQRLQILTGWWRWSVHFLSESGTAPFAMAWRCKIRAWACVRTIWRAWASAFSGPTNRGTIRARAWGEHREGIGGTDGWSALFSSEWGKGTTVTLWFPAASPSLIGGCRHFRDAQSDLENHHAPPRHCPRTAFRTDGS